MKRILILMQLQDFNRIKHRGGMENCFCLCLSKKITFPKMTFGKAATGSCSVKKMF